MKNNYCGEHAYTPEIASTYEKDRIVEQLWNVEQSYMRQVVNTIAEGASLLDIPVGTGRFLEYYQARKLQVLGIDISEAMLVEARSKITSMNVQLDLGDARSLQSEDNKFDYIICWRLFHLLPEEVLREVVHELARISAGKLYLQAFVKDNWFYLLKFKTLLKRMLSIVRGNSCMQQMPWSHIKSYSYTEHLLLQFFSESNLILRAVDVLGEYGHLRVKVYIVEKA